MRFFLMLSVVLLSAGCASQSASTADTPLQNMPRTRAIAKIHTELAAAYFERRQFDIALQEIAVAVEADSGYAPAFNVRGLIRMALREDQQADEDFRRSLRLDDKDSNTHNNYGWFLCQRGREKESIAEFLAAVRNPLYQTPDKAYVNAGVCSKKIGQLKDAEDYFQRALVRQPGAFDALIGLADVAYAMGDFAGAKSYLLRSLQSNRELSAENLWLAVRIERKVGDRNSEQSYALQLRKHFPDARETQLLLKGE